MNRLTTMILLAISGCLAGCSNTPMRTMFTSGGTGTDVTSSSGSAGSDTASSWYNSRQDISRGIYFGE